MKVYIMTDLEGASGVYSFEQTGSGSSEYEEACKLLTAEVNAAVEGALQAGADDFLVIDGHGSGGIHYSMIHPKARVLMGRPLPPVSRRLSGCDLMFNIGQHAKMGSGGNLAHTYNSRAIHNMWLNGKPVGELEIGMALAGAFDIPCVLVTGDQVVAREAEEVVPEIETVIVKEAVSQTSAICTAPERACELIREGAERAVERRTEIPPFQVDSPFELKIEYTSRALSTSYIQSFHEDVEKLDERTIRMTGEDLVELWSKRNLLRG